MFPLVLACDVTGKPHDWMTWEDAIVNSVKGNIAYEIGDPDILARGGLSRMTGLQSSVAVSSIICLKGHFKRKDKVALTNNNLFRRDNHICAYCGKEYADAKLSRDHIIPRSKGGKDVWMNVVTSCKGCNNYKCNHLLSDIGMSLIYLPYEPNHSEALILKNRRILADQMDFLKSFVPAQSRVHALG